MRVGLIGCGLHGRTRLSAAMAPIGAVELVACADLDEAAASSTALEWGYGRHYTDYGEMLDGEDLDAVMVSLPHHLLKDASLAVIASGIRLFVEKPAGINAAEVAAIRDAAEAAGLSAMVGYCMRYNPGRAKARELLARGVVGEPVQVMAAKSAMPLTHWNAHPETGGGQLRWHGGHIVDQVLWMLEGNPVRVHAETRWHPETGADTESAFTIVFEGGMTASVVVSASLARHTDFVEVFGTRGRLRSEWPSETIDIQSDLVPEYITPTRLTPLDPDYNEMYRLQMRDWVDSLTSDSGPPIPMQAAVNVYRVIDAVYESSHTGAPVAIGPDQP
jgi:predicted dehydrogenase